MTIDGPFAGDPIRFDMREIGDMRRQLVAHTNDTCTGVCPRCGVKNCRPYRAARMLLLAAGIDA